MSAASERRGPVEAAKALVAGRFPDALGSWLSGSVVTGAATATSDLDITVVLAEADAHRESLRASGWPVELFVHTEESVRAFVAKDLARRRPTMARLIATGVPLVSGCHDLVGECRRAVAGGPGPLQQDDLRLARYGLTDLVDDLLDGRPPAEISAVSVAVWQETAELVLAAAEHWTGTGKWLVRELADLDMTTGQNWVERLDVGLRAAMMGDPVSLVAVAVEALDLVGGRLWEGFSLPARLPPTI